MCNQQKSWRAKNENSAQNRVVVSEGQKAISQYIRKRGASVRRAKMTGKQATSKRNQTSKLNEEWRVKRLRG